MQIERDDKDRRVISLGPSRNLRVTTYGTEVIGNRTNAILSLPHSHNKWGDPIPPSDDEVLEIARKWGKVEFADFVYERVLKWLLENAKGFTLPRGTSEITMGRTQYFRGDWVLCLDRFGALTCKTYFDTGSILTTRNVYRTTDKCSEYLKEIQRYGVEPACEILAYKLTEKLRAGEHWVKVG